MWNLWSLNLWRPTSTRFVVGVSMHMPADGTLNADIGYLSNIFIVNDNCLQSDQVCMRGKRLSQNWKKITENLRNNSKINE